MAGARTRLLTRVRALAERSRLDVPLLLALISPSALVRAGLEAGLTQHGDFDICCIADTWRNARDAAFGGASVAIVEGALDSTGDAEEISRDEGGPALVLLLPPGRHVAERLREGFSVLPRDAPIAQIAAAAHAAAAGLVACTPRLASMALAVRGAASAAVEGGHGFEPLTPRELEVLAQMSFGLGNREIGDTLHISTHTAKFHVAQIIAKLAAQSRAHAVAKALRAGLVAV